MSVDVCHSLRIIIKFSSRRRYRKWWNLL